jgi:transposase
VKKDTTWVGLDAHKDSISVAMRSAGRSDFVEWTAANEPRAVKRLARKLVRVASGSEVRCCYEAGPCGYALARELENAARLTCEVVAPSLIPRKPGERVKTDRRDAKKLCELLEAGLLTAVRMPSESEESVRDLSRCREDLRQDLQRARHRLGKWLLRRGLRFAQGRRAWTQPYHQWLRGLTFDHVCVQATFDDYYLAIVQLEERRNTLDQQLEEAAALKEYHEPVARLRCFRGIDTLTAVGLQAELFDFRRFPSPGKLTGYLGITPSEYSSGGKTSRGHITKTGNGHVRRLLVEAAHHYRHRPGVGAVLHKRRQGQPAAVVAIADKAQHRLHRRYHRLVARGVEPNKAVVAVARELAGFVWAAMTLEATA